MTSAEQLCPDPALYARTSRLLKAFIAMLVLSLGGTALANTNYLDNSAAYLDADADGVIDTVTFSFNGSVPTSVTHAAEDWTVSLDTINVPTIAVSFDGATLVATLTLDTTDLPVSTGPDASLSYTDNNNIFTTDGLSSLLTFVENTAGFADGAGAIVLGAVRWSADPGNDDYGFMSILFSEALGNKGSSAGWPEVNTTDNLGLAESTTGDGADILHMVLDVPSPSTEYAYDEAGGIADRNDIAVPSMKC
jgi:hypothetical protein